MVIMKYVAFLRGINVGKNKLIPMADLKTLFEDMGFYNIKTYLRSGNVVFENDLLGIDIISNEISSGIENFFGFSVDCIVKTEKDFYSIINNNPYTNNLIQEGYITFFKDEIDKNLSIKLINEYKLMDTEDKFTIAEKEVYLLLKSKYHKTKFNNNYFESRLNGVSTTRNWKTILKIKEILA